VSSQVADAARLTDGDTCDHDELVARAAALRKQLTEDAPVCDRERRLTDRGIGAVTEAGLIRLMTPRAYGGYESGIRTFLDVTTELGRGCCSTAWVTGVLNVGNFVASLFPRAAQDAIWAADPDARAALVLGSPSSSAEPVPGGIKVTGRWPYASGSLHCEWASVLIAIPGRSGAPDIKLALLPAENIAIEDTWHFTGMRGTGSGTIIIDNVTVPDERILPFLPLFNGQADSVVQATTPYRNSLAGLFSVGLIGPVIGGAQAALDLVLDRAAGRRVAFSSYARLTQSPTFQLDISAAARRLETARLHAGHIADQVDEFAHADRDPGLLIRSQMRLESTYVTQQCREAVDILLTAYGSSAFDEANPLQRIWRDVNVASRHIAFGMGIPEQLYGRALIGQDPRDISYLV
jgi:3-hydroxy-9,10-secoandrosta-1,3,5(10)-triene-9,17-dione monooxygenase